MPSRRELANAIRALAMDAVQRANSGHPGMPMGMADIAEVLWNDFHRHNPQDPDWWDRDRFIISNGHGSMLQYALLHLTGYDLSMDEIRNFRQLHSRTPGHPEQADTPGVETTTGPLGQGLANGVGMALAEKVLAHRFNRAGHEIVDHRTWVFAGDGCLMEGISHEACSLAGTLGLDKLVVFYDDNGISIDGHVGGWFTDDTARRFEAYGWTVVPDVDGHDANDVKRAIEKALAEPRRPTLIQCKTVIGFGAPNKQGQASTHGAALGEDEVAAARKELGWSHEPFHIPEEIYAGWDATEKGKRLQDDWNERFAKYETDHPELAEEFLRRMRSELPENFEKEAEAFISKVSREGKDMATRKASQVALDGFGPHLPELIGGSADLSGSNNTFWSGSQDVMEGGPDGNYVYFGVREFGMTAVLNGIGLHRGFIPYGGTFLVFSDYARNAVRMSALIPSPNIHVYTHDSIGLGEDGPTHQPVEHLSSLRYIPNMVVWRPADDTETAVAWYMAIQRFHKPAALVLSRQGLPHLERTDEQLADIRRGGYVLYEPEGGDIEAIIIATGSEVSLALDAARKLEGEVAVRVVSMPSTNIFDRQPLEYRESVLPSHVEARVAVEAGYPDFWWKYVGLRGRILGVDRFGLSAPYKDLFEEYGFTVENVMQLVREARG
ncbi:MAG TPA: transketolase [Chromatiales bacterium]|nr:transketolase [Chromatiales bacterium]